MNTVGALDTEAVAEFGPEPVPGLAEAAFNATLLAHAVHALSSSGLADRLRDGLRPAELHLDQRRSTTLSSVLDILADAGAVRREQDRIVLTAAGERLFAARGFFTWMIGGYGRMLASMGAVLTGPDGPADRDAKMVAIGSSQVDEAFLRGAVRDVLAEIGPRRIVDLGCGDATRLTDYLGVTEGVAGVGVEREPAAATLARARAAECGLADRLHVITADCLEPLGPQASRGEEVDCVISFFLMHDLLQARSGDFGSVLDDIRHNYPNADTLLFADTTCDDWRGAFDHPPVFARGFELVHALMGIRLRTLTEYRELIEKSGAPLNRLVPLDVPNSWLFQVGLR